LGRRRVFYEKDEKSGKIIRTKKKGEKTEN
jgi:hypothetical protein